MHALLITALMIIAAYLAATINVFVGKRYGISKYPNFSATGSVTGMRKIYGKMALLVRCGSYIYNVSAAPRIYDAAH